jgi:cobalt-zinc-cadmium efflux system protein
MGHGHGHHAPASTVSRKLAIATAANLLVVGSEIAVGLWAGSLALIGDALHNLTDAAALAIALVAIRVSQRPATHEMSFGYQRAAVLAAFINAGLLAAFTLFIFREAWERLQEPQEVETAAMLVAAAVALAVNAATAFSIHGESREDVNIRGAFVHMVGDAVSSAGIIVAAVLIYWTGSPSWDAIVSIFIGGLILWSSYGVLRESVNLLLEGTPAGIEPGKVLEALSSIDGILGVHHLHIWALGPSSPAMSCHLMVGDVPVSATERILREVNDLLGREFRISHTTVQFELAACAEDDPSCYPTGRAAGPAAREL